MRGKVAKFIRRVAKEKGLDYKKLKNHYKKVTKK